MKLVNNCLVAMSLVLVSVNSAWAESDSYQTGLELYDRSDWIGAMPHFEEAAEEGVVEAQRRLGYILWKGGADIQQAGRWLRAAATAGDSEGQTYYLTLLAENSGAEVARNTEVRGWLEQRSAQDMTAKFVLAATYEGDDDALALQLYRELADAGRLDAVARLIAAYRRGELGLAVDLDQVAILQARLK